MQKDPSVTDLITKLQGTTNFDKLELVDYWDGDLCAIGLRRDNRLVYVSTFNAEDGGYYYELELLDDAEIDKLTVLQRGDNVPEHVLIDIIKQFLHI